MFVEHKEAGEVTEAPAKVLPLSDAIRVGAPMHEQGTFYYDEENGTTCALGAACFGAGWTKASGPMSEFINKQWPHIPRAIITKVHGLNAIRSLGAQYSYAGIADWLEAQGY